MSNFDKEALLRRTKGFSIAVARLTVDLPYNLINKIIAIKSFAVQAQQGLIIERLAGQNQQLTLLTSLKLSKKKLMKPYIFLNY
ncbi:MAG TPA: hypothetical protein VF421_00085 [Niabella sp.]